MNTPISNSNELKRKNKKQKNISKPEKTEITVSENREIVLKNFLAERGYELANCLGQHITEWSYYSSKGPNERNFGILEPQEPEEIRILGIFRRIRKKPSLYIGRFSRDVNLNSNTLSVFGRNKLQQMETLARDITKFLKGSIYDGDMQRLLVILRDEKPRLEQPYNVTIKALNGSITTKHCKRWEH